jgi:hypothetical protein
MIALILMGAAFLSLSMGFTGLPRALAEWIAGYNLSPIALIAALTVGLGILGLAVWSVAGFWTFPDLLPDQFTWRNWTRQSATVTGTALETVMIGAAATVISIGLTIACLEAEYRHGLRQTRRALWLLYLPLLVPQATFLIGLQTLAIGADLGGVRSTVIAAHVVLTHRLRIGGDCMGQTIGNPVDQATQSNPVLMGCQCAPADHDARRPSQAPGDRAHQASQGQIGLHDVRPQTPHQRDQPKLGHETPQKARHGLPIGQQMMHDHAALAQRRGKGAVACNRGEMHLVPGLGQTAREQDKLRFRAPHLEATDQEKELHDIRDSGHPLFGTGTRYSPHLLRC